MVRVLHATVIDTYIGWITIVHKCINGGCRQSCYSMTDEYNIDEDILNGVYLVCISRRCCVNRMNVLFGTRYKIDFDHTPKETNVL